MPYLNTPLLLAKVETVPGTAVVPIGTTDAFLVSNLNVTPIENDVVRRKVDRGFAGAVPGLPTKKRNKATFDVELAGSGAAITPAKWGTLLRACLFAATTANATEVTYPLGTVGDGDALSMYPFLDAIRHRSRGVRGSAVFKFTEGDIPTLSFDLLGLLVADTPVDAVASGAITLPTAPVGVEVNYLNTILTLDGFVVGAKSVTIDIGTKPTIYSTTGGIAIVYDKSEDGDRRAISFSAQFEMPDIASKNYFTSLGAGSSIPMSLIHGTAAGNIIDMSSAGLVLETAPYAVETNRMHLNVTGKLVPTAAGNELVLKTR